MSDDAGGWRRARIDALADQDVREIDPGRAYRDPQLSGTGVRRRGVTDLQAIRRTVAGHDDLRNLADDPVGSACHRQVLLQQDPLPILVPIPCRDRFEAFVERLPRQPVPSEHHAERAVARAADHGGLP